jgi:S1-C subfamily serine protease
MPERLALELTKERLGLEVEGITPKLRELYRLAATSGVVVVEVDRRSPAHRIGIAPGDVVKQVNRQSVRDLEDFKQAVLQARKSETVVLLVQRGRTGYYVTLER